MVKEKMQHLANVNWVVQPEALGTAHALTQALPHIENDSRILILTGDAPLVPTSILAELIEHSPEKGLGIISTILDNPEGYGRIVRNPMNNNIIGIVEQKDTNAQQAAIQEIYAGIMTALCDRFKQWLPLINNGNAQQEYYLTDAVAVAIDQDAQIGGIISDNEMELRGINNLRELIVLEKYFYLQNAYDLMSRGVTIRDPDRFILRGELIAGTDIVIDINTIIEGKVSIGNNSYIGANTIIRNSQIGDRVVIDANCVIDSQHIDNDIKVNYVAPRYEYVISKQQSVASPSPVPIKA